MSAMHMAEILRPAMVMASVEAANKETLLTAMVHHAAVHSSGRLHSEASVLDAIMHREELGSTGVGGGVAIPHAKIPQLDSLLGIFARIPAGINFDSMDGSPVTLVFMLLVPEQASVIHLKALARVSRLLKNELFKDELLLLQDTQAIYAAISSRDEDD